MLGIDPVGCAFKAVLGHAGGKKIKEEFEEEVGSLDPVTLALRVFKRYKGDKIQDKIESRIDEIQGRIEGRIEDRLDSLRDRVKQSKLGRKADTVLDLDGRHERSRETRKFLLSVARDPTTFVVATIAPGVIMSLNIEPPKDDALKTEEVTAGWEKKNGRWPKEICMENFTV